MLSYISISQSNLLHNLSLFRNILTSSQSLLAVVKGNAYGHGQVQIVRTIEQFVDGFACITIEDIRLIRSFTQKPVLMLGYIANEDVEEAIQLHATLGVYDENRIRLLHNLGKSQQKKISIHLKVDCLLGRQGILPTQIDTFIALIKRCPFVHLEAIYSHFANIEDTSDFTHAQNQIVVFQEVIDYVKQHGFPQIKTHISSTAGSLLSQAVGNHDFIRLGIGLYGMWPSLSVQTTREQSFGHLQPVLRWVTHIAQVKTLPPNHPIGYGLTYITSKPTTIAIIPQGYCDGYDRALSNNGEVLIHETRCPILGRVAMNMFVVNVSHLKHVAVEDEVVLLGSQGKESITAEEIAEHTGTINYEITTRISPLLPRICV